MPPQQSWPLPCSCDNTTPYFCEHCRRQQESTAFLPPDYTQPQPYDLTNSPSIQQHQRDFMSDNAVRNQNTDVQDPPPHQPMNFNPNTPYQPSLIPTIERRQPQFPPINPFFRVREYPPPRPNGHPNHAHQTTGQSEHPRDTARPIVPSDEITDPIRRYLEDRGIPVTRVAIDTIAAAARRRHLERLRRQRETDNDRR